MSVAESKRNCAVHNQVKRTEYEVFQRQINHSKRQSNYSFFLNKINPNRSIQRRWPVGLGFVYNSSTPLLCIIKSPERTYTTARDVEGDSRRRGRLRFDYPVRCPGKTERNDGSRPNFAVETSPLHRTVQPSAVGPRTQESYRDVDRMDTLERF